MNAAMANSLNEAPARPRDTSTASGSSPRVKQGPANPAPEVNPGIDDKKDQKDNPKGTRRSVGKSDDKFLDQIKLESITMLHWIILGLILALSSVLCFFLSKGNSAKPEAQGGNGPSPDLSLRGLMKIYGVQGTAFGAMVILLVLWYLTRINAVGAVKSSHTWDRDVKAYVEEEPDNTLLYLGFLVIILVAALLCYMVLQNQPPHPHRPPLDIENPQDPWE